MSDTPTKVCPGCKVELPLTSGYFHLNKEKKSGFGSRCKRCCGYRYDYEKEAEIESRRQNKCCPDCKREFPTTHEFFHIRRRSPDGLSVYCKECVNRRSREWGDANRERVRQKGKNHYRSNPEPYKDRAKKSYQANPGMHKKRIKEWEKANPDKVRKTSREWEKANPDKRLKSFRKYYEKSKGVMRERSRKWARANPEKARLQGLRRRARKANLPDSLTSEQWQRCLDYFKGCCAVCGRPANSLFHAAHADHWIALSNPNCPGTTADNMIVLCSTCNQMKHAKNPIEWLEREFGAHRARQISQNVQAYFDHVRSNPL